LMQTAFKTRRGTCEKRFDSRPVSAATLSFGTTPPDPRGSRRGRKSAPRRDSQSRASLVWSEVALLFHHRRNLYC
jgi:hypothetical protein